MTTNHNVPDRDVLVGRVIVASLDLDAPQFRAYFDARRERPGQDVQLAAEWFGIDVPEDLGGYLGDVLDIIAPCPAPEAKACTSELCPGAWLKERGLDAQRAGCKQQQVTFDRLATMRLVR